ncbi:MAG: hypothetical protein MR360_06720, partial [Ruminococcus sp.]
MKKILSITSLCLALLMISFSTVFAVDNQTENHNVYYYLKGATSSNNETTVGNHYNTVINPNSPYEIDYVVVTVNNK